MTTYHEVCYPKFKVWKELTEAYDAHLSEMFAGRAEFDDEFKDLIKRLEVAHAEFMGSAKQFVG